MNLLKVRVQPRCSQSRVEASGEEVKVWVTSPPVDGEANKAVLEVLASALGVKRGSLTLHRGHTSRSKEVDLGEMAAQEALLKLSAPTVPGPRSKRAKGE